MISVFMQACISHYENSVPTAAVQLLLGTQSGHDEQAAGNAELLRDERNDGTTDATGC